MCISFITTNNSTGSPPQLNVDSGGAFNLSGSLTANHLVFTCYQNGIWTIQRDEPLGNCGNGLYTTCAGSDSSHFLLTTGESLADPPQNGHCIIYKSTISPGATPNLLKTDGGTYYKVVFQGNDVQLGAGTATLCFTNADTNGAVSPAVWEVIGLWNPCGPDFLCTVPQVAQDLYMAQNAGTAVALYGYEGGQSLLDPLTTIGRNMVVDFVKSVQFGTLYQQYLTNLHHAGMIEEQLYEDPRRWLNGIGNYNNFWGFNPGTYTYTNNVTSVIQRQLGIYSWINSNPCWWSGCTIH